jgi:enamine deaminase RidA (YjgF/YER057c/UK114 family)
MVNQTESTQTTEERIKGLGIEIPGAPKPLGLYVEAVQSGNLLFLTGAMPIIGGGPRFTGKIGTDLTAQEGFEATRLAVINALAIAREHLGTLDRVTRILKTEVYVVIDNDLTSELPRIANGASELLCDVFGAEKLSTRKVIGVASIPLGVPVMVELLFEVVT